MSFTVQEARAAFLVTAVSPPLHVGGPEIKSKITCQKQRGAGPHELAQIISASRDLNRVQVYRAKENRNVTKEIPQRINQAWR